MQKGAYHESEPLKYLRMFGRFQYCQIGRPQCETQLCEGCGGMAFPQSCVVLCGRRLSETHWHSAKVLLSNTVHLFFNSHSGRRYLQDLLSPCKACFICRHLSDNDAQSHGHGYSHYPAVAESLPSHFWSNASRLNGPTMRLGNLSIRRRSRLRTWREQNCGNVLTQHVSARRIYSNA